ncbi:MAG: ABC transporter substrate-binding protein [Candidatus Planktophila sp.]|nr:ABC transporter substrate-binding protein [Candidatus Planktophila sp.]PHX75601.1 MAG: ABC transporter substrate-binding protein [Actinomycetota bacterium]
MKKVLIIALSLLLSGCSAIAPVSSYTISPNDVRAISLSETGSFSVSRVVVLANGVAEIMNSLRANSLVVGRDISSAESGLEDIPIVTSGHQVLPEKVIALRPDLVIVDASTGPRTALDQIRSTGITIVQTPESWTLADIAKKVRAVGVAIGAQSQAELLVTEIERSLSQIKLSAKPRVAFLYLRGTSSIYLIGGPGSGADSMLQSIGAIDIGAQSLSRPFNTLTAESLALLDPDVLLVMTKGLESVGGVNGLIKLPGVAQTKAGKNRAIIDVDDSLLLSFGPRTPSLVEALAQALKEVAP